MNISRLMASTMWSAALGITVFAHGAHAQTPCQALNTVSLPLDGTATVVGITAVDVAAHAPLPAFCLVDVVISSNGNPQQSLINNQYWLPEANWNGRFLGFGNGGFAGTISTGPLAIGLLEGYAAGNTDLGTGLIFGCNSLYCGSRVSVQNGGAGPLGGLYGDDPAIEDFGYGATHLMTLAGKEIVQAYYNQSANHAYFHGCSTGGQQALMEAQRFPADYDGILAGSPAYDRTHLHIASAAGYQTIHAQPDAYLTDEALALTHSAMLKQCAGTDGGLATDDYLTKPAKCGFSATVLQCTGVSGEVPCTDPKGTSCTCLTPHQAVAMNGEWSGARDSLGRVLYPGYERGVEEPVPLLPPNYTGNLGINWQESGSEPAFDSLDYWAFGPSFYWQQLFAPSAALGEELVQKIAQMDNTPVGGSTFAGVLNANSTDLSAFSARGGKLIMYAGYEDPLIPTASSIDYYNGVHKHDAANIANYMRLYLAPGMWHCNSGPGVDAFGNLSANFPPIPGSPADDVQGALVTWVEAGAAPGQITATHYVNDTESQGIAFQRPLCVYPQNAKYEPSLGSPLLVTSYRCVPGSYVTNQQFSPIYGPQSGPHN